MQKKEILNTLTQLSLPGEGRSISESGAITNIVIFDREIVIDLNIATPALHIKKRIEKDVTELLKKEYGSDITVKINMKVKAAEPKQNPQLIKGKPIEGIQNIVAVASG
ncbi:iron-sulfur cluster assembly protein, partial [Flavobacteriaceae bacterium]|nr:iron-sulfur cluster assembly protein [Flavobacteriaceae bacterium]